MEAQRDESGSYLPEVRRAVIEEVRCRGVWAGVDRFGVAFGTVTYGWGQERKRERAQGEGDVYAGPIELMADVVRDRGAFGDVQVVSDQQPSGEALVGLAGELAVVETGGGFGGWHLRLVLRLGASPDASVGDQVDASQLAVAAPVDIEKGQRRWVGGKEPFRRDREENRSFGTVPLRSPPGASSSFRPGPAA